MKSIQYIAHHLLLIAVFGNQFLEVFGFSLSQPKAISGGGNYVTTLRLPLVTNQVSTLRPKASVTSSSTTLHATSKKHYPPPRKADFEYQELNIQMQAMQKQDVKPSQLTADKRVELEGYVKRILEQRDSILPLNRLGDALPQTKWRMAFSTEPIMSDVLPKDAIITLNFLDEKSVEYSLNFSKTLGLKRLTAKSSYTVDSSRLNPGLVSIQYENITTDVFGLTNIGVGAFGLLKGRGSYIQTAFFDGRMWIEKGTDLNGIEYYNVYARDEDNMAS